MRISDWSSDVCSSDLVFEFFVVLLFISGLGIGIFKAGALALIGDISRSTREHAATMNLVEGFFGVGAIVGPAIVTLSLQNGASWKLDYLIASGLCLLLVAGTLFAPFPARSAALERSADAAPPAAPRDALRSEEHTSELQSLMR